MSILMGEGLQGGGAGGNITCGDRKFMRGGGVSCRGILPSPLSPFSAARDPF